MWCAEASSPLCRLSPCRSGLMAFSVSSPAFTRQRWTYTRRTLLYLDASEPQFKSRTLTRSSTGTGPCSFSLTEPSVRIMASVWKRLQRVGKHASKFQFVASYQELMVECTKKWWVCEQVVHSRCVRFMSSLLLSTARFESVFVCVCGCVCDVVSSVHQCISALQKNQGSAQVQESRVTRKILSLTSDTHADQKIRPLGLYVCVLECCMFRSLTLAHTHTPINRLCIRESLYWRSLSTFPKQELCFVPGTFFALYFSWAQYQSLSVYCIVRTVGED